MKLPQKLRHLFLKIYFMCRLYLHGFLEMITQLFRGVAFDKTVNERDFREKVAFVTGGTSGIGRSVSMKLCQLGMTVVAAGPHNFAPEVDAELKDYRAQGKLIYMPLHLESFRSIEDAVDNFSRRFQSLDYLINNAGIMLSPYFETVQGFEGHMGVNLVGHAKLTKLLLPKLNASDLPRIINVASSVHQIAPVSLLLGGQFLIKPPFYSAHLAYVLSKLAVILYTKCLADQLQHLNSKLTIYSVHPGVVASSLYRHVYSPLLFLQKYLFSPIFFRSTDLGAAPIINCALVKDFDYENGCYVENGYGSCLPDVSRPDRDKFWKMIGQLIHKSENKKQR